MADANVDELTSKLGEYVEQLNQIEQLLVLTPNDPELLKLKTDLEQIVALTHDLSQSNVPESSVVVAEDAKWQVNDRCMSMWDDGRWYAAKILEINHDEYLISYLDYKQKATVSESALKPYAPAPADQLESGNPVRAIFDEDGYFYDSVIVEKSTASGFYMVRFPRFGKELHEVSAYNIALRPGKNNNPDEPLPDKPVIPESLWQKPTDTQETIAQKKRKIKRIKQLHKKRKVEEAGQRKQNSWQQFQKKGKGGFGKKKKSIFATSEKGTVGVVGSGKGMTPNPERRQHQYNDAQLSVLDE